jgi:DNA-directed RNA polymerase subunit G
MEISDGKIVLQGKVSRIERSKIPKVFIITIDCGDVKANIDLVKDLLIFKEGETVELTLSHEKPQYQEGKDLVIWGYIMSKKKQLLKEPQPKIIHKLLVSLWGFLLVIESENEDLCNAFSIMDKVYLKIRTLGS